MNKKILIGIIILTLLVGFTVAQLSADKPSDIIKTNPELVKEIIKQERQYVNVTLLFSFNNEKKNYEKTIDCNYYADSTEQTKEINRITQIAIDEDESELIRKGEFSVKVNEKYYDFTNKKLTDYTEKEIASCTNHYCESRDLTECCYSLSKTAPHTRCYKEISGWYSCSEGWIIV